MLGTKVSSGSTIFVLFSKLIGVLYLPRKDKSSPCHGGSASFSTCCVNDNDRDVVVAIPTNTARQPFENHRRRSGTDQKQTSCRAHEHSGAHCECGVDTSRRYLYLFIYLWPWWSFASKVRRPPRQTGWDWRQALISAIRCVRHLARD